MYNTDFNTSACVKNSEGWQRWGTYASGADYSKREKGQFTGNITNCLMKRLQDIRRSRPETGKNSNIW